MTQYNPIPRGKEDTVGYVLKMPLPLKEALIEEAKKQRVPLKDLILKWVSKYLAEADYSAYLNEDGNVEIVTLFLRIPHEVQNGLRVGARCEATSIRTLLVKILTESLEIDNDMLRE